MQTFSSSPTPSTSSSISLTSSSPESPTDLFPVKIQSSCATSPNGEIELSCRVCGAVPAIHVYGSYCCGGCKIFFLRCAVGGKPLLCTKGGQCTLPLALKKCRACRYQKCIRVGLLPNIPGQRAQKRRLMTEEERGELVGKVEPKQIPSPIEFIPSPQCLFRVEPNYKATAITLVELERTCGSNADEQMMDWNLPLKEAQTASSFMPKCCARAVAHLVDWLKATPEVWALEDRDRVYFCSRLFTMLFPLQLFFYTYKLERDGLLSGLSDMDISTLFPEFAEVLSQGALCMQKTVLKVFKDLRLSDEEYVVLKNIIIFSNALGLSEKSADIVRKARTKYEAILVQIVRDRFREEVPTLRAIGELMNLRQALCSGMLKELPYLTRYTSMNTIVGASRGQISAEIFLNSFSIQ
ncbi:unnamed protein product, partial [Mesorhabditis belari]|uniref:Nuclear receptor domain-containing protein n=1 Tax=Mesorhabditis belari TaxID=2138241 RepID=A0AAF3FMP5_9BILA